MKQILFAALFLGGALLAATSNIQLTVGSILMVIGYNELRKAGITLDQLDDILLAKIKELSSKKE